MNDTILYGKSPEERIVGIAPLDEKRVTVWTRDLEHDIVESRNERVHPFLFCTDDALLKIDKLIGATKYKVRPMQGENPLKNLMVFETANLLKTTLKSARENKFYGDIFTYPDICTQYLVQTGKTFFKGMTPTQLYRLQVDIETYTDDDSTFSNPERDPIIIISICDNRGYEAVLHVPNPKIQKTDRRWIQCEDEAHMLVELIKIIHRRDPDVIEHHNGFGFDFPYIKKRCEIHGLNFAIGRDSKRPATWPAEKKFAERDITYTNFTVGGRSMIDTMFLAIDWDVYARKLNGVGLKDVAKVLGVVPPDRTYVEGHLIAKTWREDPDSLLSYALDDVYETRGIAEQLCASVFFLTQMMPMPYQQVHLRGKAAVIQSLFIREYVRQREPLPNPQKAGHYEGGYTDIFQTGVFDDLLYADVASLYPSIMLNYGVQPASDTLEIFQFLLGKLTELRFEAKNAMKQFGRDSREYKEIDARQSAYKIIINSFYGALGAGYKFRFSDHAQADLVTRTGRALLVRMMQLIVQYGGDIIECDTDGVLFVRPPTGLGSAAETHQALIDVISKEMPEGINVDLDGYFPRMMSLKKKNYALKAEDGKITIKGGSLKSRGMEPLFREYIVAVINLLLNRRIPEIQKLHERYKKLIVDKHYELYDVSKTATLKMSLNEYKAKVENGANKAAQYEIALKRVESGKPTDKGDRISWVICGDVPKSRVRGFRDGVELSEADIKSTNTAWYLSRLQKVTERFKPLFTPDEYKTVFSKAIPDGTGELFEKKLNVQITNVRLKEPFTEP